MYPNEMKVERRIKVDAGLGKKWSVLAYINLFIMQLKAKLRKRKLSGSTSGDSALLCKSVPKVITKRNNWMNDEKLSQTGVLSMASQMATTSKNAGAGDNILQVLKSVKSGLCGSCCPTVDVENGSFQISTTVMENINATNESFHHTSMTRRLAFGPWLDETNGNMFSGFFKRITLAQVTTMVLIIICIIIVSVIYTKEAEINMKWQRYFDMKDIDEQQQSACCQLFFPNSTFSVNLTQVD